MILEYILAASSQSTLPGAGANLYSLGFFLIFLAFMVMRRVYRGMNGMRFSTARLLRIPIVYLILTVISMLFVPLEDIFLAAGIGVAGFVAGFLFGDSANFYMQGENTFYRRSPIILTVWLLALIARVIVEIVFSQSTAFASTSVSTAAIIVDLLLAGSTGLMAGETLKIYRKYEEFKSGNQGISMTDQTSDL